MYRIFVGGLHMETNSFNPQLADCSTFTTWLEGSELGTMRGTSLELGGVYAFFDGIEEVEVFPGFFAQACTSGRVKDADFHIMVNLLLKKLREAGKVDGVLLVQHGAMLSETIDDCEGYVIEKVRGIVGGKVPICSSFDFHALMTSSLSALLDGATGYQTYPHVDHFETGYRAASILLDLVKRKTKPLLVYHRIPLIMSCENSNTIDSPVVPAIEKLQQLLDSEGVLSGSLYLTQPWLDVKELGCTISLYIEDTNRFDEFSKKSREILDYIWESRNLFYPPMLKIQEALEKSKRLPSPIIFVDYGDVPNAGGTGDSTYMLKEFLKEKMELSSVVVIADEDSTKKAELVGEGNSAVFNIGGFGKAGEFNERIPVEAKVIRLNGNPFVHLGPAQKGFVSKPGMRALLQSGNIYIILTEKVCTSHDRNMLISMGLNPEDIGIIAMRATHTFFSCYQDVMKSWMYVDTPGFSTRNLKTLPFANCDRPIFPLDDI